MGEHSLRQAAVHQLRGVVAHHARNVIRHLRAPAQAGPARNQRPAQAERTVVRN
jgi:hypothetical protein